MTMLLPRPDIVVDDDHDAPAPYGQDARPVVNEIEVLLRHLATTALPAGAPDRQRGARVFEPLAGSREAADQTDTGDVTTREALDPRARLKSEAIERLSHLMRDCETTTLFGDRLSAIRIFLDGWQSIDADLVSRYGEAGNQACWASLRTVTGRWIEQHVGTTGLPVVVDSGITIDGLAAIVLAATPDYPPLLRLNASIVSRRGLQAIVEWAQRALASGRPVSTLNADDL